MRILILQGSPRKDGNTARVLHLLRERLDKFAKDPIEFDYLWIAGENLLMCRGCRVCFDHGEEVCPLHDSVLEIKARMLAADGIVFTSPIYVNSMSGTVKNFIDRLCHVCHRPHFGGKWAFIVSTTGGTPGGSAMKAMRLALMTWGYRVFGMACFPGGALSTEDQLETRHAKRLDASARRILHQALRFRRTSAKPTFVELMIFAIQQRTWKKAATDSYDYAYWRDRGWFNPGCTFFYAHKVNPVAVAAARLCARVIALAFA